MRRNPEQTRRGRPKYRDDDVPPASDRGVLRVLREKEDLFRGIAEDDNLPEWVRQRYGVKALELMEELEQKVESED